MSFSEFFKLQRHFIVKNEMVKVVVFIFSCLSKPKHEITFFIFYVNTEALK